MSTIRATRAARAARAMHRDHAEATTMLYLSIGFFVLAIVAGMFVFLLTVSAPVVALAETLAAAFFGVSALAFMIDRAWGAFALRRASREPLQARVSPLAHSIPQRAWDYRGARHPESR